MSLRASRTGCGCAGSPSPAGGVRWRGRLGWAEGTPVTWWTKVRTTAGTRIYLDPWADDEDGVTRHLPAGSWSRLPAVTWVVVGGSLLCRHVAVRSKDRPSQTIHGPHWLASAIRGMAIGRKPGLDRVHQLVLAGLLGRDGVRAAERTGCVVGRLPCLPKAQRTLTRQRGRISEHPDGAASRSQ